MGTGVRVTVELVRALELAVCCAVLAMLVDRYRRYRAEQTGVALALFGALGAATAAGWWSPSADPSTADLVLSDLLICLLLTIPYLLVRFSYALGGTSRRVHDVMAGVLAAEVLATVVVPPLPGPGEDVPPWAAVYIAAVVGAWTAQSATAARGLWRAGRAQSSVVRHRMRSLSSGSVLLALTIVVAGASAGNAPDWVTVVVTLLGLASVLLFALAFLLPASLRVVWRQEDLSALASAERGLMAALNRSDVAATIVPVLATVFSGGAALLDDDGGPVRTTGLSADEAAELVGALPVDSAQGHVTEVERGTLAARLAVGWLVVRAGRLSPVFGDDEAALLSRVATLVDLALQRVTLHERERGARVQAEAANRELEMLLYSVSHDLRSPLISVLGYLDVLRAENAEALSGSGAHYVERITVNAVYMQNLIADLLELSRIGRVDAPAERLDLHATAQQVVDGARLTSPQADVRVLGRLPVVRMNDVRARQLLTNLVDNALKHGGRPDLRVTVRALRGPDGELVLEVTDDGRGIPEEYRERVLQVFERLDAPKSSPGTGMGLAICRRIAESLGGTLVVDGPPPDAGTAHGTTVRAVLPAALVVERPDPAKVGQNA